MNILIYKTFGKPSNNNEFIYFSKKINYVAINLDTIPNNNVQKKLKELKKTFLLVHKELIQTDFYKLLNLPKIKILDLSFSKVIDDEDDEYILKLIEEDKIIELISILKKDEYYYQIQKINILLLEFDVIFYQQFKIEIINNSLENKTKERIIEEFFDGINKIL